MSDLDEDQRDDREEQELTGHTRTVSMKRRERNRPNGLNRAAAEEERPAAGCEFGERSCERHEDDCDEHQAKEETAAHTHWT